MTREAKINVILLLVAIMLSLLAWWQPFLSTKQWYFLSDIKRDNITTIRIERKDLDTIVLNKENNNWFLEQPYTLAANPLRVDTLTALVEKQSYSRFESADEDLYRYELDKPLLTISFNHSRFVFGGIDPVKRHRYVMNIDDNAQSGKNTVHLINGVIYYQLRSALNTFISPSLLPPSAHINAISWLGKTLKNKDNKWLLTPDDTKVTSDSIAQLLQFWQHAQASKIETNVDFAIDKASAQSRSLLINITYPYGDKIKTEDIKYLIIQQDKQLKLVRLDYKLAYWISPQTLKSITEFLPVQETME